MNEEMRNSLKNAGFQYVDGDARYYLRTGKSYIFVKNEGEELRVIITLLRDSDNADLVVLNKNIKDLAELSKVCYPFNGCKDLNFEAKKYSWEECVKEKGWYVDQLSRITQQTQRYLELESDKNLCRTESQALSILATTQLMQICAEINKDFASDKSMFKYYPILNRENEISYICRDEKLNQFEFYSQAGVIELLRTNTPLLLQYFEKQAK